MAALRLLSIGSVIGLALAAGFLLQLAPNRFARPAGRFLRVFFCRLGCRALGLRVEIEGGIPAGVPVLLIANHISWTDVLALGSVAPIVFTARHDLATWPALGALARHYGALFVNRDRRRLIPAVNREMARKMAEGEIVALFPEATTGDGTRLKKFNSSHFAAARDLLRGSQGVGSVAITPATIAYTRRSGLHLGRNGRAAVAWYGDTDFAPHLLDLAQGGPMRCRIRILAPIWCHAASDRKRVARDAEAAIRSAFVGEIMEVSPEKAAAYVLSARQVV